MWISEKKWSKNFILQTKVWKIDEMFDRCWVVSNILVVSGFDEKENGWSTDEMCDVRNVNLDMKRKFYGRVMTPPVMFTRVKFTLSQIKAVLKKNIYTFPFIIL